MPIFELAVRDGAPPKDVCPAHKWPPIRDICRDGREICDLLVGSIKDLGEFYSQPLGSNVVRHHGDDTWVATVNPLLALLLLSSAPAPRGGCCLPLLPRAYTRPLSYCATPTPTATATSHPAPTRRVGSIGGGEEPLEWVHRAFNSFCESDVVRDFVDETCWPSEPLATPKLCLDQDGVEEGAPIGKDCPSDVTTNVRGE
jgi:hypothetical protein